MGLRFFFLIVLFFCGSRILFSQQNKINELVPGLFVLNNYDTGIEHARSAKKPVLIYFKDKVSPNCKKFESNIFSNEAVKNFLNKNFIVICLLVVDNTPLTETKISKKTGKQLRTIGEYNYDIEQFYYKKDVQPFCAGLNNKGQFIECKEYTSDPDIFLKFLKGIKGK